MPVTKHSSVILSHVLILVASKSCSQQDTHGCLFPPLTALLPLGISRLTCPLPTSPHTFPFSDLLHFSRVIYFISKSYREIGKGEIFHLLVHSPDGHKSQGCVRPNPGSKSFIQVFYVGGGDLNTWVIYCISQAINRKLRLKQNSWDTNQYLPRVLAL